ncbi:ferredoxin [Nocardia sp. R7R-8]|uniref:ferredoxin n=1 Tax=Nocardia sp. R7R-8 TaxID=3459304 RepID=UPI00403DE611
MAYVIGAACIDVTDKSCMDECPMDCIYEGARKMYINPKECIDCGACLPACPVEAITLDRKTPEELKEFVADNLRFFTEPLPGRDIPLGAAPGAIGRVGLDTELVGRY